MLPIYTRTLTPADYGVLQLLEMTVDVGTILIVAGMTAGLQKYYFDTEGNDRKRLVVSAFALEMSLGLITTAILVIFAPLIWIYLLKGAGEMEFIQIAGINFSLSLLSAVPLQWLQIERRSLAYISLLLLKLVAQIGFNIYFLVGLDLGVRGILLTSFLTNGILGGALALWMLGRTGIRINWSAVRNLRSFGLPYQATFLAVFIMTFGDRYFLQSSHGESAVGLYSLAYSFGFLLTQISSVPFLAAWNPQRYEDAALAEPVRQSRHARAFRLYNLGLLTTAAAIALSVGPGLRIIASPAFQSAAGFVPIVLLAYVFQSWTEVVKFGIDVTGRTRYISYAAWISMIATLVLYAVLIPRFGGHGAAWATLGGFGLRFVLVYRWSQRLRPMHYEWAPAIGLLALATALTLATIGLPAMNLVLQTLVHAAMFGVFALIIWCRIVHPEDRLSIIRLASERIGAFRRFRAA